MLHCQSEGETQHYSHEILDEAVNLASLPRSSHPVFVTCSTGSDKYWGKKAWV